jgi:REP element-mobilizing transposase RayT
VLVTLRLVAGLPTLRMEDSHGVIREALKDTTRNEFRVVEYSVQSNHLHLLVEARDELALARGMIGLSVRLARRLNRLWRRRGKLFADRYHARILRTPREVRAALLYVLQNAHKHGAWVARRADVYSSGPEFEGWREKGAVSAARARLLERPRTWLLSCGWRRQGRIGLLELPKGAVAPLALRKSA